MLNITVLKGRLGKDPEVKQTKTGKVVCSGSIAVPTLKEDEPIWMNVEAWDKTGEFLGKLKKGTEITVTGRIAENKWEDTSKVKHSKMYVVVDSIDVSYNGKKAEATA